MFARSVNAQLSDDEAVAKIGLWSSCESWLLGQDLQVRSIGLIAG